MKKVRESTFKEKVGDKVKEHIEASREDLKKEKKDSNRRNL